MQTDFHVDEDTQAVHAWEHLVKVEFLDLAWVTSFCQSSSFNQPTCRNSSIFLFTHKWGCKLCGCDWGHQCLCLSPPPPSPHPQLISLLTAFIWFGDFPTFSSELDFCCWDTTPSFFSLKKQIIKNHLLTRAARQALLCWHLNIIWEQDWWTLSEHMFSTQWWLQKIGKCCPACTSCQKHAVIHSYTQHSCDFSSQLAYIIYTTL